MSGRSTILVVFEGAAERLRHAFLQHYIALERRKTLAFSTSNNKKNSTKNHIWGADVDNVLLVPERELQDDFGPIWVDYGGKNTDGLNIWPMTQRVLRQKALAMSQLSRQTCIVNAPTALHSTKRGTTKVMWSKKSTSRTCRVWNTIPKH